MSQPTTQTHIEKSISARRAALALTDAGWHVFPVASSGKAPAIRGGFTVDREPVLAPWAAGYVEQRGSRYGLATGHEGLYWGTRDAWLIGRLFDTAKLRGGSRIGIVSDRLVIDVDHPDLLPADMARLLTLLPSCATPSGGAHYFCAAFDGLKPGAFRTASGEQIGDLKHLSRSYSLAYDGVPSYGDCAIAPPDTLAAWLVAARGVRCVAQRDGAPRTVRLGPSSHRKDGQVEPEDLARASEGGRHDLVLRTRSPTTTPCRPSTMRSTLRSARCPPASTGGAILSPALTPSAAPTPRCSVTTTMSAGS